MFYTFNYDKENVLIFPFILIAKFLEYGGLYLGQSVSVNC